MRSRERRKTVGGKIQNYTPPTKVADNIVVIDGSNESTVSPVSISRSPGDYSFQIKSNLGLNITIASITPPAGDTISNTFPLVVNSTPVTINCNGSNSGDHTIVHNGINTPFIVNATISAPSAQ